MRDYFEVLGVERRFHFSDGELEKRFLALSKEVHPDRFAKADARTRVAALQKSTELNDAYKVLKHDVKRAEYLLKLEGLDVADEKLASVKAPPALLSEVMELNEELAEAQAAGDQARIDGLRRRIEAERARTLAGVDQAFYAHEAGDRSSLEPIAHALIALRYHARFLEQVEGEEAL